MRRVERLLTQIRRPTDNESVTADTQGVQDEELLEALNDAQAYLQQELETINSEPFERESFLDTVSGQEAYDLPDRIYLGQNVVLVECLTGSGSQTYYPLRKIELHERRTVPTGGMPSYYVTRNKQILLNPFPTVSITDGIRLNAVQQLPRLDKRRAQITAVTVSSGEVTDITVDATDYADYFQGATEFSASRILVDDHFSIVDADGNIKARNIPITAIAEVDVADVDTITFPTKSACAAGDYVVVYDTQDRAWAVAVNKTGSDPEPTGPIWSAIPAARKAQANLATDTTAAQVAARFEDAFNNLTGFATAFTTSDVMANGLMTVTNDTAGFVLPGFTSDKFEINTGFLSIAQTVEGSATGEATITSYTPESTSETASVGDYLVAGANATTHSELPLACEPFLITWGKWQIFERDNRFDSAAKMSERLQLLEKSLKDAWHRISDDVAYIPILNTDYLFG